MLAKPHVTYIQHIDFIGIVAMNSNILLGPRVSGLFTNSVPYKLRRYNNVIIILLSRRFRAHVALCFLNSKYETFLPGNVHCLAI